MPPAIPFVASAFAVSAGLSMTAVVAIGAVTGAVVAATTGENILKGALMGGLAGYGASVMLSPTALPTGGMASTGTVSQAESAAMGVGGSAPVATTGLPQGMISSGGVNGAIAAENAAANAATTQMIGTEGAAQIAGQGANTALSAATSVADKVNTGSGLLDKAISFADAHPAAAKIGLKATGDVVSGIAGGMAEKDKLNELRKQEAARLARAGAGVNPYVNYTSGMLNNGMQIKPT